MRILFVCTANACRSQMAEGWARHLAPADWEVGSAGLVPYPVSQREKSLTAVRLPTWDVVVTLSEESGRYLPRLRSAQRHLHRPVDDPMSASGTPDEVRELFRAARDRIAEVVRETLAAAAPDRVVPPKDSTPS